MSDSIDSGVRGDDSDDNVESLGLWNDLDPGLSSAAIDNDNVPRIELLPESSDDGESLSLHSASVHLACSRQPVARIANALVWEIVS